MRPKYIKDAIIWDGQIKCWLRIGDLNLITHYGEERYTPASRAGRAIYLIDTAFPYEDWMVEYIGTDKNLEADERFKSQTDND